MVALAVAATTPMYQETMLSITVIWVSLMRLANTRGEQGGREQEAESVGGTGGGGGRRGEGGKGQGMKGARGRGEARGGM